MKIIKYLLFFVAAVLILKVVDSFILSDAVSRSLIQYVSSFSSPPEQLAEDTEQPEFQPPPVQVHNEAPKVSSQDKAIAKRLAQQNAPVSNEYMFYLKNGASFKGVKEDETDEYVTVKLPFGHSGFMVRKISKQDIDSMDPLYKKTVVVTEQEIALKKDLPSFRYYSDGRYSIFTDQDFFKIKKRMGFLKTLAQEFTNVFGSSISGSPRRSYVIIFGEEAEYRAFAQKVAPALRLADGFYNPGRNCLVFYDFFQGENYRQIDGFVKAQTAKIAKLKKENQKYLKSNPQLHHANLSRIKEYEHSLSDYLSRSALATKGKNISILRHEAAHQLTFDLLGFNKGTCELWLLEGLAEYFASPVVGAIDQQHLAFIREAVRANVQMGLRELFSYRSAASLFSMNKSRIGLFYAESWALFYYLMQPVRQARFLRYLNEVKDVSGRSVSDSQRIAILEKYLGPIDKLEEKFFAFVK